MTQEVTLVSEIAAPFTSIKLASVSADISVRQGEGAAVQVLAQTPSFWLVTERGTVREIGGPVAEALDVAGGVFASTAWINDVFYVNNRRVNVPNPRQQLVVLLPADFAAELVIESRYFGDISVAAELRGKVKATVSSRVSLTLADQLHLTRASLAASASGRITTGRISAPGGEVSIEASSSGVINLDGNVNASEFSLHASSSGRVSGKNFTGTAGSEIDASSSARIDLHTANSPKHLVRASSNGKVVGKRLIGRKLVDVGASSNGEIEWADIWSEKARLQSSMSGFMTIENIDVRSISAEASMSGKVDVSAGSAESGGGSASMSGRVSLVGDFATVSGSESMSGRFRVTQQKGAGADRITRAVRRNFNRDLLEDSYVGAIGLAIGVSVGPAMQNNGMAEALADDAFVTVVSKAVGVSYADPAVVEAIRKCGAAFAQEVGPVEKLADTEAVTAALQAQAVAPLFGETFQLFLTTLFKKAEAFAS